MGKNSKTSEVANEVAITKLIKFTFAPIGAYGIAAFIGDVAEIESELADKIVSNGHAEYVSDEEVSMAEIDSANIADEPIANADETSPEGAEAL